MYALPLSAPQLARLRLVQLAKACIAHAGVSPPNPKSADVSVRRVVCPEARLINFNVLLKNFVSQPDAQVLAKARRFTRRQLQPSVVAYLTR